METFLIIVCSIFESSRILKLNLGEHISPWGLWG